MSLLLSDVIAGVRSRNPAFDRRLVPDKSLADFFTTEQRRLMTRALERDKQYLAQALTSRSSSRAPMRQAPRATAPRVACLPNSRPSGAIAVSEETAGSLVTVATDGVATLVNDTDVVSATATSLVGTRRRVGGERLRRQGCRDHRRHGLRPAAAHDREQHREPAVWTDAWSVVPDSTSTFKIVSEVLSVDATAGARHRGSLVSRAPGSSSAQRQRRPVHRLHEAAHGLRREGRSASAVPQHPGRQRPLHRHGDNRSRRSGSRATPIDSRRTAGPPPTSSIRRSSSVAEQLTGRTSTGSSCTTCRSRRPSSLAPTISSSPITATACSSRAALCSRRFASHPSKTRHQSPSHPSTKRRPKLSRLTWPRSVSRDALEQAG
jgi:hypothetical protein